MKDALSYIISASKEKKLLIQKNTVRPLDSAGFMSKVFSAQTDKGKVIIHVVLAPLAEQVYQEVPRKIKFVGKTLKGISQVPKVYMAESLPKEGYFIVQEYKEGQPLGRRVYKEGKFSDEFLVDNPQKYLEELQDIVFRFHSLESNNFGYLDFLKTVPKARHKTWENFLFENFDRNLKTLHESQSKKSISYFGDMSFEEILKRVQSILMDNKGMFETKKARLIHGDVLNYSNILISEKGIEGIIDFEWSLFGHPAWEFVFNEHPPLDIYISRAIDAGIISKDFNFRRSVELHNIFWCAWGASVHADNPKFGPALFRVFIDELKRNS